MSAILSVFTDEEANTERLSNLPQDTQLAGGGVRVQTRQSSFRGNLLMLLNFIWWKKYGCRAVCSKTWHPVSPFLFSLQGPWSSVLILKLKWLPRPFTVCGPLLLTDSLICPMCSKYRGRFGQEENNGQWIKAGLGLNTDSAVLLDDLISVLSSVGRKHRLMKINVYTGVLIGARLVWKLLWPF